MPSFSLPSCELGVATSATQIEGGGAQTNWHRWAGQGHILDDSTPARADDHWNRVGEDVSLLQQLGVRHYRMGIEWARVEPFPGEFDQSAIDHYRDELAALRDAGIHPLVTLHHFSNPLWFEDSGGFRSPHAVSVFLRYVGRVVSALGDLVEEWITLNEPNVYASRAYLFGEWPPGLKDLRTAIEVLQVMSIAHIEAYLLIHRLQPQALVGTAHHLRVFVPKSRWNPRHLGAACAMDWLFQGALVPAMNKGRFLLPFVQPKGIRPGRYYDFQGINYYSRSTVTHMEDHTADHVPVNDLGWEIYPDGLITVAERLHAQCPGPLYITENGTADSRDAFRSRFLYEHLARIAASGLPIERYYHWTFIDNWEWLEGESARFGLVQLDFETQVRTVRPSGRFFADIVENCGVTEESYQRYVAGQMYPRSDSKATPAPGD